MTIRIRLLFYPLLVIIIHCCVTNRAPSDPAVLAHVLADLVHIYVVVSGTKSQIPRVRRELHNLSKTNLFIKVQ